MECDFDCDEPREKCGVFGIYAPELDVSRVTFFALVALQHRGQESCGIATYDTEGSIHKETGMGLVNQVFTETNLKPLKGFMGIGHTRYSTAGRSVLENAQPMVVQTLRGQIAIAQNGNLTTTKSLRQELLEKGVGMFRTSDVEIITQMLAANPPVPVIPPAPVVHINPSPANPPAVDATSTASTKPPADATPTTPAKPPTSSPVPNSTAPVNPPVSTNPSAPVTNTTNGTIEQSTTSGKSTHDTWENRISAFMEKADGAYSLVLLTSEAVFGVRDYLGMRPLCIGSIAVDQPGGGQVTRYVIASETCAINTIGGKYVREVRPGEIVRLDAKGITSFVGRKPSPSPAFCVFEYVYFSRPDSLLQNQLIHRVRQRLGEQLAIEAPPPPAKTQAGGDGKGSSAPLAELCVIGVPDSSLPAAIGYANKCGISYSEGLTKNRYIHRTFIQPTDYLRKLGVSLKFNPLVDNISGKRVVLIDDSIVRGNTITALVSMIRGAGAVEVHVRISSPPVKHPCFMGIDMATHEQLVSHNRTTEDVCKQIGADSLAYLSHEGMMRAVEVGLAEEEKKTGTHCSACFTGKYPLPLDW